MPAWARREDRRGLEGIIPNPKLKLLDQMREVLRLKYYAIVENHGCTRIDTDAEGTNRFLGDPHCSPDSEPKSMVGIVVLSIGVGPCPSVV
jgi:hypothetical protein